MYGVAGPAAGDEAPERVPITIARAQGPIVVDANFADAGWIGATRIDTWYETSPGDNTKPIARTVGYLTYDDSFFYIGLELSDPDPQEIRSPLGDRDSVGPDQDYAGVILDSRHDGKRAVLLVANAKGIQYDAVVDDAGNTRDASPDFYWDSRAAITLHGWALEIRVPFSSLRYDARNKTWGIILLRNYPRTFRYQIHSSRLPRGAYCLVCYTRDVSGLEQLPSSAHLVAAPYMSATHATGSHEDRASDGSASSKPSGGFDLKWMPGASAAFDATINPDFSQIEADSPQIVANERFAIFLPERRPFFLEGIDLLKTPLRAVHTRTITSPRWGLRVTGRDQSTAYSALLAHDRGGGTVILPKANGSDSAPQDFRSFVVIGRIRRDVGDSHLGGLFTARETPAGHNRVFGPDFQWRHNRDRITGQFLVSQTLDTSLVGATSEGQGKQRTSHALYVWFARNSRTIDWFGAVTDIGAAFRSDVGFIPQAGFRALSGEVGYEFHPKGLIHRVRPALVARHTTERGASLLAQDLSLQVGLEGRLNTRLDAYFNIERVRALDRVLPRRQLHIGLSVNPSRTISEVGLTCVAGQDIDFENARSGSGASAGLRIGLRASIRLQLLMAAERRWLNVAAETGKAHRLFTADTARLRAAYSFSARTFVRGIVQYSGTWRETSLYDFAVRRRSGSLSASVLFGHKLSWQSVFYAGYGDERAITEKDALGPVKRQLFMKVTYALQR